MALRCSSVASSHSPDDDRRPHVPRANVQCTWCNLNKTARRADRAYPIISTYEYVRVSYGRLTPHTKARNSEAPPHRSVPCMYWTVAYCNTGARPTHPETTVLWASRPARVHVVMAVAEGMRHATEAAVTNGSGIGAFLQELYLPLRVAYNCSVICLSFSRVSK